MIKRPKPPTLDVSPIASKVADSGQSMLASTKRLSITMPDRDALILDVERVASKVAGSGQALMASSLAVGSTATAVMNRRAEMVAVLRALEMVCDNVPYSELSKSMQAKLKSAGLGGDRGVGRDAVAAESFYEATVPDSVQLLGEDAIREFVSGKDASHIESFHNSPDKVRLDSNYRWEDASANRSRGGDDMTQIELVSVDFSNGLEAFTQVVSELVPQAVLYGVMIETSVSIVEQTIYIHRGMKSWDEALKEGAMNVARAGVMSLVAGGLVSLVIVAGGAPFIAAVAPVLGLIGGALLVYTVSSRLHKALSTPDENGEVLLDVPELLRGRVEPVLRSTLESGV